MHFSREMISALAMALIAIVYVIQAFKIPTGSMENSLLVGDFLLGLKFMYGSPVVPYLSYKKFPGVTDPQPGDVIIFKFPGYDGKKDYIKRCVAGPGQTIQVSQKNVIVDGDTLVLPPKGQYQRDGRIIDAYGAPFDSGITYFKPLRIPKKGDVLYPDSMGVREIVYFRNMVHQENPRAKVALQVQLYVNGQFANSRPIPTPSGVGYFTISGVDFDRLDNWNDLAMLVKQARAALPNDTVAVNTAVFLNGQKLSRYEVKYDNYFMMGDNRDNSADSRYWGFLNRNFVKAKAFILYFSLDKDVPLYLLPLKIRWNRIGKLIRSWDGKPARKA